MVDATVDVEPSELATTWGHAVYRLPQIVVVLEKRSITMLKLLRHKQYYLVAFGRKPT